MQEERERRYQAVTTRITVLEDALQHILRRLGAPPEDLQRWRRAIRAGADTTQVHSTMNDILARLKPPPNR
jgi:hypothetical protein